MSWEFREREVERAPPFAVGLSLREDVRGAPVRIGQPVRIQPERMCETLDERFLHRSGVVVGLLYDDPAAQFPHDPLVEVAVEGLGRDWFFPSELKPEGPPSHPVPLYKGE